MLVKRLTLAAGVETAFEFDSYQTNSVVVKNETADEILFCDGPFDAAKAAHIPAFSWQSLNVRVFPGETPAFYVKATVSGVVEIDFGSSGMGGAGNVKLSGSNVATGVVAIGFDMRGLAAKKPAATAVPVGTTYWSVDTDPSAEASEVSDGTNWVVM